MFFAITMEKFLTDYTAGKEILLAALKRFGSTTRQNMAALARVLNALGLATSKTINKK